jgi:hypothetical protein
MIEYTTALAVLLLTFLMGLVSVRIPLAGFIVMALDLILLIDPIQNSRVIIGYSYSGGVATAITQTFTWLPLTCTVAIMWCLAGGLLGMVRRR